jgi:hypothetical protein
VTPELKEPSMTPEDDAHMAAMEDRHQHEIGQEPAARRLIGPTHAHLDAPCTDACYEPAERVPYIGERTSTGSAEDFPPPTGTSTGDNQLDVPQLEAVTPSAPPMTLADVDSELVIRLRAMADRWGAAGVANVAAMLSRPVESGPTTLSLPKLPPGTVALVGDQRWRRVVVPGITLPCWQSDLTGPLDLGAVLDGEPDGVTVEFAPREARTWPQIAPPPEDISAAITVEGIAGTWYRVDDEANGVLLYRWERTGQTCTVLQLRQIGEVREVLDA